MKSSIKVNVGSLVWTIKKVPKGSKYLIHEDGDICYGICNTETLTIYIQGTELNSQLYKSYLIHEIAHAFIFSTFAYTKRKFDEEELCCFMQYQGPEVLELVEYCYKELF